MTTRTRSDHEGWKYVYEALQNVRCLQLLLFHCALTPERDCVNFIAVVVRHGSLRCAWNSPTGTPHSLVLPLPACLIDLSLPIRCWTRQDHVEIRLGLLSLDPALHALSLRLDDETLDLNAARKIQTKPFSVDFDAQALESGDGVQFFCRTCSCQLTNAPFSRVIEVPSLDWREVSEHFYGNCCCASFGAQAELLAARFQQLLTPSEGTCLVASTACIVHKGDVITSEVDRDDPVAAMQLLHCSINYSDPRGAGLVRVEPSHVYTSDREDTKPKPNGTSTSKSCAGDNNGKFGNNWEGQCKPYNHQNSGQAATAAEVQEEYISGKQVLPEGVESKPQSRQDAVEEPCCSSGCSSRTSASPEFSPLKAGTDASPEILGNGFMAGSQAEVLDWEPFFCRSCSSLVGARRVDSSKTGLQFFKCQISTSKSVPSSSNIFREHTLERLFTHELAKNTESDSSYRYVVRSFQTGRALFQLVILNQNALVSSSTYEASSGGDDAALCSERPELDQIHDRKLSGDVSLETVAKVMFCDCRMLLSEELR